MTRMPCLHQAVVLMVTQGYIELNNVEVPLTGCLLTHWNHGSVEVVYGYSEVEAAVDQLVVTAVGQLWMIAAGLLIGTN